MLFDMNSNGNGAYDLREFIQYYHDAPAILKLVTNHIVFTDEEGFANSTSWDKDLDKYQVIKINEKVFGEIFSKRDNLQLFLYHEMAHCLDRAIKDKSEINYVKFLLDGRSLNELPNHDKRYVIQWLNDTNYILSKKFKEIVEKEKEYFKKNGMPIREASWYAEDKGLPDNFADTIAISAFYNIKNKRNAYQAYDDGDIFFDDWIKEHEFTYDWAKDLLETLKPEDITWGGF